MATIFKLPKKLADMGYTEEGLDADNPYTQHIGNVFGDLPEPTTMVNVRVENSQIVGEVTLSFHHGMPEPHERINICARTYEDARVAHRNMAQRGKCQGVFKYIGVAEQMRQLRECRVFLVGGWSRLIDAPMIEQLAKAYRVELVNYEVQ